MNTRAKNALLECRDGYRESIKGDGRKGSGNRKFFLLEGNVNVDKIIAGIENGWVGKKNVLGYHIGKLSLTPTSIVGSFIL